MFRPNPSYIILLFVLALLVPFVTSLAFKEVKVESLPVRPQELTPGLALGVDKKSVVSKKTGIAQTSLLPPAPVLPASGITVTRPVSATKTSQELGASARNMMDETSSRAKALASSDISKQAQDSVPRDMFADGITISKRPAATEKKLMQEKQIIAW